MRRRNWKRVSPRSLRHAMELCKDHAREVHNRSVERIAEVMGLSDHYSLYKYFQTGRMPAVLIPAFEAACGIDFVSRWLATRGGRLVIQIPTGRALKETDIPELQQTLLDTVGSLMAFYRGDTDAEKTIADVNLGIQDLAWHRGNVQQHQQPQLELGEHSDD